MTTESESLSEQLLTRAEELGGIGTKIETYSASLGTEEGPARLNWRLQSGTDRTDLMVRVGTIRRLLGTVVLPRIQQRQEAIIEQLLPAAQTMLEERFRIGEIRGLAEEGFLPAEALPLAQQEMDAFRQALDRDRRRGLLTELDYIREIFGRPSQQSVQAEPQKPEEPPAPKVGEPAEAPVEPLIETPKVEEEKLAQIEIYLDEKRVVTDGRERRYRVLPSIPSNAWELLVNLSGRPNEDIKGSELNEFLRSLGSTNEFPLSSAITVLRNLLEVDPKNPKIVTRSGRPADASYRFNAEVKIIRKTSAEEIPAEESEEERKQRDFANIAAIQGRIDSGQFADPEVIAKAQEYARQVGGTIEFTKPAEDTRLPEFSKEERAVLGGLVLSRNRIEISLNNSNTFVLTLRPDEIESCDELMRDVQELKNGSLKEVREAVLQKIEKIFRSEKADDLVLEYSGDLGNVLVVLFALDRTVSPSYLFDFLRSGLDSKQFSNDVYDWIKHVIRAQAQIVQVRPSIQFEKVSEKKSDGELKQKPAESQVKKEKRRIIEEDSFELLNGRIFVIKATHSTIDTFRLIWEGHLSEQPALLEHLARADYGKEIDDPESDLDLAGAKNRITANITGLNRLLDEQNAGYFIKNLTSKEDSSRGIPSRFGLVEIPPVQTDQPQTVEQNATPAVTAIEPEEESEQLMQPELLERQGEQTTEVTKPDETLSEPKRQRAPKETKPKVMDYRDAEKYAKSKGLEVTNGGRDSKIVDPNNNNKKVVSVPGHHGGRDFKKGTLHGIIKAIDEYLQSKQ